MVSSPLRGENLGLTRLGLTKDGVAGRRGLWSLRRYAAGLIVFKVEWLLNGLYNVRTSLATRAGILGISGDRFECKKLLSRVVDNFRRRVSTPSSQFPLRRDGSSSTERKNQQEESLRSTISFEYLRDETKRQSSRSEKEKGKEKKKKEAPFAARERGKRVKNNRTARQLISRCYFERAQRRVSAFPRSAKLKFRGRP